MNDIPEWLPVGLRRLMADPSASAEAHTIIGAERISAHCQAIGDFNPIHWNPAEAKKAGFANVVAPGSLLSGLVAVLPIYQELLTSGLRVINTGVKYAPLRPPLAESRLAVRASVEDWKEKGNRVVLTIAFQILSAGGSTCHLTGKMSFSVQQPK